MSSVLHSVDTGHSDMLHDAQLDYYAKRLATCSSDRTVKVYDVAGEEHHLVATLTGHEGPVWEVSWAHPKFGTLLASCSYDRRVLIFQETAPGSWQMVHCAQDHQSSVNSVSWAPHEYGLMLASASSDGRVAIVTQTGDGWSSETLDACPTGVNAVTWAPPSHVGSDGGTQRLATAGCDNFVRVWRRSSSSGGRWELESTLGGDGAEATHTNWVRDVAWAPASGVPANVLASCGEDGKVIVWTQSAAGGPWEPTELASSGKIPVWRVSWSTTGNLLAVSAGDGDVTLWKQTLAGRWEQVSAVEEEDDGGEPSAKGEGPASVA